MNSSYAFLGWMLPDLLGSLSRASLTVKILRYEIERDWERSRARHSLGLRTQNYMVAQDESGEIEVTEGGTSCGSFDVRVGTSRPAASCVGLLPKLCAWHTKHQDTRPLLQFGSIFLVLVVLSYLRALKPTLERSVIRVSEWLIWVHSIIERNTVDLIMNFRWIGKLHVQSENRREIWGSQNKFWEQPLFSDFLLLIVNLRPFEKF